MRFSLGSLLLLGAVALTGVAQGSSSERCFPDDFLLGSATASYQVEGGWNALGRTPSIWDDFCREQPSLQCANVADDFVHRYKDDIQLMADTGLSSFRFSISWSRVMNWNATAKRMERNQPGIDFYHSVIDELNKQNVVPILTLYHWDLPRELHVQYSPPGWLNSGIVDHFVQYTELMYTEYGSKVTYWSTFNEPWSFTMGGYGNGMSAPGFTNSKTNAYTAAHNVLISHANAVSKFRSLKEAKVIRADARIGIVLCSEQLYPHTPNNASDIEAAERKMQFMLGWFLQPIVSGEYPAVMRERAGNHLPYFTTEQSALLKGSYDLFMLNYYSSHMITDCASSTSSVECSSLNAGWERDLGVDDTIVPPGAPRSAKNKNGDYNCPWFTGYPQGYMDNIKWMHKFDPSADILLTENGYCGNEEIENEVQLWYYQEHLNQVYKAVVEEKIPVIGYTAWSLLDNYEWGSFNPRFGLYYVNFTSQTGGKEGYTPKATDLQRIPRLTARWYSKLATTKCLDAADEALSAAAPMESAAASWSAEGAVVMCVAALAVVAVGLVARKQRNRSAGHAYESSPLLNMQQKN